MIATRYSMDRNRVHNFENFRGEMELKSCSQSKRRREQIKKKGEDVEK